jgi:hypothetical protein
MAGAWSRLQEQCPLPYVTNVNFCEFGNHVYEVRTNGGELLVIHQGPAEHEVRQESMSLQDDLRRLSQLRNSGALTEEEFVAAKAALLQDPTSQSNQQRAFWTRPRIALATAAALVICAAFVGVGMALASRSHDPQTSATGATSGASPTANDNPMTTGSSSTVGAVPTEQVPVTFTARGTMTVPAAQTSFSVRELYHSGPPKTGESCDAGGQPQNVPDGSQVQILDGGLSVVGAVPLPSGKLDLNGGTPVCVFSFTVSDVPTGSGFFTVMIATRESPTYTTSQLESGIAMSVD